MSSGCRGIGWGPRQLLGVHARCGGLLVQDCYLHVRPNFLQERHVVLQGGRGGGLNSSGAGEGYNEAREVHDEAFGKGGERAEGRMRPILKGACPAGAWGTMARGQGHERPARRATRVHGA